MSTACAIATEAHETRPQLLIRTTRFLKRVSNFRTTARKGESRPLGSAAYQRSAQSMDLGSGVLTKVEVRAHHHSFDQNRNSGEESPSHISLRNSSPPNHRSSTTGPLLHQIDGLPHTIPSFRVSTTTGIPSINATTPNATPSPANGRAQTLPSRARPSVDGNRPPSSTVGPSTRRALAPRLATLPPPLMAQYTAGGSARLTPSLVSRQRPMPILNLPTLPPPTPPQPARPARPVVPLRSLPALPMQGPGDTDNEADHENASLDEDDEDEDADGSAEDAEEDAESDESSNEEGETSSQPASAVAGPSRLPPVDTSGFSISFGTPSPHTSISHTPRTPYGLPWTGSSVDYFNSKRPEFSFPIDHTPRPSDFIPSVRKTRASERVPQPRAVPMPATPDTPSARPGLYHQASKSMVDLMSMTRKEKGKIISPQLGSSPPPKTPQARDADKPSLTAMTEGLVQPAEAPDDVITSPMLRRRRSLPVYEPSSDPPPYPDPVFRRRAQATYPLPSEEEGHEPLPDYSNAIFLTGVMPRKTEFTRPGVQAKDRKWRRVYCVLEGTAFRVYKCPPAASRVGALERWWENKVGAADSTSLNANAVTASGIRVSSVSGRGRGGEEAERIAKIVEEPSAPGQPSGEHTQGRRSRESSLAPPPAKSRLGLTSRFLRLQRSKSSIRLSTEHGNSSSRLSMDSRQEAPRQRMHLTGRHSMDTLGSSRPSNASSTATNLTTSTTLTVPSPTLATTPASNDSPSSRFSRGRFLSHTSSNSSGDQQKSLDKEKGKGKEKDKETCYTPDPKDLICQYSLQHAESGLASDYQKRKNVIRVRMAGEQFLLQAKDVAAVIDWIEGIQMGTNVALDIDERPMPRGPIFPRRRRRRARRPDPASTSATAP